MIDIGREIVRVMAERGVSQIGLSRLLGYKYSIRMTRILKSGKIDTELLG